MKRKGSSPPFQAAMLADPARSASDGFANPTAFLGESSPLMSSGTFFRRGLTGNMELAERRGQPFSFRPNTDRKESVPAVPRSFRGTERVVPAVSSPPFLPRNGKGRPRRCPRRWERP